eukprot:4554859-Pyramimonas_sp.AAC.1
MVQGLVIRSAWRLQSHHNSRMWDRVPLACRQNTAPKLSGEALAFMAQRGWQRASFVEQVERALNAEWGRVSSLPSSLAMDRRNMREQFSGLEALVCPEHPDSAALRLQLKLRRLSKWLRRRKLEYWDQVVNDRRAAFQDGVERTDGYIMHKVT